MDAAYCSVTNQGIKMRATVKLTIGSETKEVTAFIWERMNSKIATISGLTMTTIAGKKQHTGWATFNANDSGEYNLNDASDIRYHGMRGNGGYAKPSNFRHIGF